MNIRVAQQSDLSHLSFLWYERIALLQQTDTYFTPLPDAMQVWEKQAALWLDDDNVCFFVAEVESVSIGYVSAKIVDGPIGLRPKYMGAILDIGLDLHHTHRNLGGQLVDEVKHWLKERDIRIMMVNLPARYPVEEAFWRSVGGRLRFNEFWMKI